MFTTKEVSRASKTGLAALAISIGIAIISIAVAYWIGMPIN